MKVNVDKVLERDAKLSELDSRAGTKLVHQSVQYVSLTNLVASCKGLRIFYLFVRKVFLCSMSPEILFQMYKRKNTEKHII